MFQNQYGYQPFSFLEGTVRVGFLTAHRDYDEGSFNHLQQHIMGEISVNLIPVVIAKRVYFKLGGGFSVRNRKEVTAGQLFLEDRQVWIDWLYNEESRWDTGYHIQTMLGVNIGNHWFSEGKVYLAFYDQGSQVAGFGLSGGYRF